MSKYFAVYKCSLCGAIIKYGNTADLGNGNPESVAEQITDEMFARGRHWRAHDCKDGNIGIAYFAGIKREK